MTNRQYKSKPRTPINIVVSTNHTAVSGNYLARIGESETGTAAIAAGFTTLGKFIEHRFEFFGYADTLIDHRD